MGRPFAWTAGKTLFKWFAGSLGWTEDEVRDRIYFAAVCRCFPGKLPKGGDRVPAPDEIENCSYWMERRFKLLRPRLVGIPVGKLAIGRFMEPAPLLDTIGRSSPAVRIAGQEADCIGRFRTRRGPRRGAQDGARERRCCSRHSRSSRPIPRSQDVSCRNRRRWQVSPECPPVAPSSWPSCSWRPLPFTPSARSFRPTTMTSSRSRGPNAKVSNTGDPLHRRDPGLRRIRRLRATWSSVNYTGKFLNGKVFNQPPRPAVHPFSVSGEPRPWSSRAGTRSSSPRSRERSGLSSCRSELAYGRRGAPRASSPTPPSSSEMEVIGVKRS